ncbi:hypothetical protein [Arenibaculum pallidiluteum]|uniref:hypothetical protein n=1 Tax=Arenibaculum pallidiluteum TaxID=2812559 RepID=UPI001A961435|nr:hypothetical protein [Arenibaculum pallidiluteum]
MTAVPETARRATRVLRAGSTVRAMHGILAAMLAIPLLAACADSPLLDRLGGGAELPAASEGQPAPAEGTIRRATGEELTFPNLASVPPRPTAVRTPAERQVMLDRLRQIRAESEAAAGQLETRAPIPPNAPQRQAAPQIPPLAGAVPPPSDAIVIPPAPRAP